MAQQAPWWWQYYQGQGVQQPTPPPNVASWNVNIPGGPPPDIRQQQAIAAQQYQQQFQNQPDLPPISPQARTTAPEAPPGQELGSPTPSPTPPPYSNIPPGETSNFYSDIYRWPNPSPNDENPVPSGSPQFLYNPPTNDENPIPDNPPTYYGGGPNPVPNEDAVANPVDQYRPPAPENVPPNEESNFYSDTYQGGGYNPEPNTEMVANPVDQYRQADLPNPVINESSVYGNYGTPSNETYQNYAPSEYPQGAYATQPMAPTGDWNFITNYDQYPSAPQSDYSMTGSTGVLPSGIAPNPFTDPVDLFTGGPPTVDIGPSQDTNRYVPAGDGGQYVYDENWQPGGYQPPPDQPNQPSTTATGGEPSPSGAPTPAPPFAREGSGMMGTWQDYANVTAPATPPPYTSLFDQPSGQNIGAGPLPGSFAGLGSGGGGNLGGWDPFRNLWYGNQPYSPSNFANLTGWENSQGNALAGAQFYPGQTPGPIIYGPTAGGSYSNYLSAWNSVNSPSTTGEADPWGSFGHPSHSGTTSAQ